eukprot:gnl/MRDRNA2_/MRDRNA2_27491_c0_seq1.p1 gnl/MRDRNA2_/MRDRNA2_27491_c0~~gnl/MRDRNA2_/MRDRNA2_27491_c0_seq1.p1  ORF type:complete len:269 (+),score=49.74 gnl/MRDRNA2_/MRDRNA2_27491_c0_seq1:88-894(+)
MSAYGLPRGCQASGPSSGLLPIQKRRHVGASLPRLQHQSSSKVVGRGPGRGHASRSCGVKGGRPCRLPPLTGHNSAVQSAASDEQGEQKSVKPDFQQACRYGDVRIVEMLLRDAAGRMPPAAYAEMAAQSRGLTSAVAGGAVDTMHLLIKHGFNPNRRDDEGTPPLVLAVKLDQQGCGAFHRDSKVITLIDDLVKAGANIALTDSKGRTALWWAAKLDNLDAVKRLLELGANPAISDKKGQKAVDVATDATVKAVLGANSIEDEDDLQ